MKKYIYRLFKPWEPRKCYFPYPEGYCSFNKWSQTAIDFKMSKSDAQLNCDELNGINKHTPSKSAFFWLIVLTAFIITLFLTGYPALIACGVIFALLLAYGWIDFIARLTNKP